MEKAEAKSKEIVKARDLKKQKKKEAIEEKEKSEEYAYIPREGFNWDNVEDNLSSIV